MYQRLVAAALATVAILGAAACPEEGQSTSSPTRSASARASDLPLSFPVTCPSG